MHSLIIFPTFLSVKVYLVYLCMLFALQFAGYLNRIQLIHFQL
jgi:hypothetical protein